ncbi:MAG TPA: hypothetical protein VM260_01565 [Pirellula sp.]|nr:hypothetical protein [Pirellula sp.]
MGERAAAIATYAIGVRHVEQHTSQALTIGGITRIGRSQLVEELGGFFEGSARLTELAQSC